MNHLLVPLNFSSDYENVLKYATSFSLRSRAELTLFFVGGRRFLKKGNSTITFHYQDNFKQFFEKIKDNELGQTVRREVKSLLEKGVPFQLKSVNGSFARRIERESRLEDYNMVVIGTDNVGGLKSYFTSSLAANLLKDVEVPMFVVPVQGQFKEIEHITYAVDLSIYDPNIIRQIKSIASIFDAKLTIAHVNQADEANTNSEYLRTLEQTISDTLDYPKIFYKFFDHGDVLEGILKLVRSSNTHMLAMTNRHNSTWKDRFNDRSITRRMAEELSVPLLAFHKN